MTDPTPVPFETTPERTLRVGDAERYQAASALGEHFATGRLDQDEYDTRVRDAYAARTRADLQRLFADLPAPAPFRPAPPAAAGWDAGRTARDRIGRHPAWRLPIPPVVLILVVFLAVSLIARFPVFPLLFLLWFGWGRRAWR
ncbi:MAG TPA: DUF1707 domain-containing protein [Mycobacteriales bacterium]|nr:DUF1707 domain-containing protein [Mycobacteriales bacterium]